MDSPRALPYVATCRNQADGPDMLIDNHALLIGAMKCGTSTLFSLLAQHPQICPAKVKEPEYFARNQDHRVEVERYEDLWDCPSPDMIRLEASTGYSKWPGEQGVPERIRDAGLSPRFLYITRDPIKRIESHWNHLRKLSHFDLSSGVNDQFVHTSRYHAQLARFREVFPERERYMVMEFDELLRDPVGMARRCFEFLGVDTAFEPKERRENLTHPLSTLELRLERLGLGNAGAWLPVPVKSALRKLLRRGEAAPAMKLDDAQQAQIRALLREDMLALQRDYGIDVAPWGLESIDSRTG